MKPKVLKEDKQREMQWKVESALRTISDYNNLQKDKSLMQQVKKAAVEQVKMLGGIVNNTSSKSTTKSRTKTKK